MVWVFFFCSQDGDVCFKARITETEEQMIRVVEDLIEEKKWWLDDIEFFGNFEKNTWDQFWYNSTGIWHWICIEIKNVRIPESGQLLLLYTMKDMEKIYRGYFNIFESADKLEECLHDKTCECATELADAAHAKKSYLIPIPENPDDVFWEDGGYLFKPINVSGYSLTKSANKT